ncbi:uncharacterized protein BX664DRAFT_322029 [Halteromyces radiatus]|uniref:uncharacterized protein n=1 Tax=Halteromyces radiatus TaxID=101107 RepID=UPI002220452C|nr:uncharacterized protein BX664DRAFT_322029 [Halteromyces radiatus]KAI8099746.1 hypothetical protein BX664DRAFT_322029 [Halteromyces radiatus]
MKWSYSFLILLVMVMTTIKAIPISVDQNDDFIVDIHAWAQIVSTHFLFDHVDPSVYQLSQHIASTIRTSLTLDIYDNSIDHNDGNDTFMTRVDLNVLLGQLQGAVGSFLEDKLPGIWNRHLSQVNRNTLQTMVQEEMERQCPRHNYRCLHQQGATTTSTMETYLQAQVEQAWNSLISTDLPPLVEAAKTQVHGVVDLFEPQPCLLHWTLSEDELKSRLDDHWQLVRQQLQQKQQPCPSRHQHYIQHWLHTSLQLDQ